MTNRLIIRRAYDSLSDDAALLVFVALWTYYECYSTTGQSGMNYHLHILIILPMICIHTQNMNTELKFNFTWTYLNISQNSINIASVVIDLLIGIGIDKKKLIIILNWPNRFLVLLHHKCYLWQNATVWVTLNLFICNF